MYDLPQFSQEVPVAQAKSKITPTTRLMWPELQDDHLENSRKVPLDRHDIIIDKLAVSHDSNQVVAVTSNNMVSNDYLHSGLKNLGNKVRFRKSAVYPQFTS